MKLLCQTCEHDFLACHLDTARRWPTLEEQRRRKCKDCRECHPPEDAPVREREREGVPA
jgi:hypothetical protein